MFASRLEDFPAELLHSIFDYFWADELYRSFSGLNTRFDVLLLHQSMHLSSEREILIFIPFRVCSLVLNSSSPVSLDDFVNVRSLTLIRCDLSQLQCLPARLSRLCVKNTRLPPSNIQLIWESTTLINVELNLQHRLSVDLELCPMLKRSNSIQYLTINYLSIGDLIRLLDHTPRLTYLHVSLFGQSDASTRKIFSLTSVRRLVCLSLNVPFDVICDELIAIYFPCLVNLSIFTSYIDPRLFISSLERLLIDHVPFVKKLNVSVQLLFNRLNNDETIQSVATRFRTAFWLKRHCRVTFKCCNNDSHVIRLYLQTSHKTRTRPSRFTN